MTVSILHILQLGLDAATLRQRVIANNVANANTPGFKRSEVTFEERLRRALGRQQGLGMVTSQAGHLNGSPSLPRPQSVRVTHTSKRPDGNNVDLDLEQVRLAATTIQYQALTQQVSDQLAQLRYVINEGRR